MTFSKSCNDRMMFSSCRENINRRKTHRQKEWNSGYSLLIQIRVCSFSSLLQYSLFITRGHCTHLHHQWMKHKHTAPFILHYINACYCFQFRDQAVHGVALWDTVCQMLASVEGLNTETEAVQKKNRYLLTWENKLVQSDDSVSILVHFLEREHHLFF